MNTKLLVGLGAAGILAVGACFGGVVYTKSTAHSKMRTTGYQIEDMFRVSCEDMSTKARKSL